jgi:hypothetical protein
MTTMLPYVQEQDKKVLWNNLPYCGLYNESPFSGNTYTNLATPDVLTVTVLGKPLPLTNRGVNKDLRLIGFDEQNLSRPVTTTQLWRLVTYSQLLEYRVEWSTMHKCKIGFYTPNILLDTDPFVSERRTILIGRDGPCLFDGKKGGFYFTDVVEFCVVVDKNVNVQLDVKCRAPCSVTFPALKLYKPIPYRLDNGCVFAYETKLNDFSQDVSFVPTKKYIRLTADIRKYIIDTSVLINFDSTLLLATDTLELKNLLTTFENEYYHVVFPPNIELPYKIRTDPNGPATGLVFPIPESSTEQHIVRLDGTVSVSFIEDIPDAGNNPIVGYYDLSIGKFDVNRSNFFKRTRYELRLSSSKFTIELPRTNGSLCLRFIFDTTYIIGVVEIDGLDISYVDS